MMSGRLARLLRGPALKPAGPRTVAPPHGLSKVLLEAMVPTTRRHNTEIEQCNKINNKNV